MRARSSDAGSSHGSCGTNFPWDSSVLRPGTSHDLFRVRHVRQTVVTKNVGEVPGFVDDLYGFVTHPYLLSPGKPRFFVPL